jgi:hypothetical protein
MNAKTQVKRLLWIVVVLGIGAYLLNGYYEKRAKERNEREEVRRIEKGIRSAVDEMVSRFNARSEWPEKLSKGEEIRIDKILTIELERLWLSENPILFVGSIQDVSTIDHQFYRLRIERSLFSNLDRILFTRLCLELKCDKGMLDPFLAQHPKLFSNLGLNNGVAVVAKIEHIKTESLKDKEGNDEEMKVGVGDCLEITYTGQVEF